MKVAIYVRLSKEDDDVRKQISGKTESESIQNQKSLLIQYAMDRGYEIHDIYSDEDYSGADRNRPAFNKLIQDASKHKFDIVLAKSQSRFTRDMELVERYLHGKFVEWGIRFIAVVDHVDTNDIGNKKARQINGLVNEWYLEDLSNNVRTVLTHKRHSGQHIGSFAPYGYQKDPDAHNHLIIDPEAADVVRRIFAMALAGYGVPRIVRALNADGIPNPTAYKRAHGFLFCQSNARPGDDLWSPVTIHYMLCNRIYVGDMVQGRHKKASYKSKKILSLPKDQWIVVPNTHEPIIGREEFEQIQKLRGQRALPCSSTGMIRPLAKKVFCACCGASMQLCRNGQHRPYLRCSLHVKQPTLCQNPSIASDSLDALILQRIQQHLREWFDPDTVNLSELAQREAETMRLQAKEHIYLQQEVLKRENALRVLYQDKSLGLLDDEMFSQLNQGYLKEKKRWSNACTHWNRQWLPSRNPRKQDAKRPGLWHSSLAMPPP